MKKTSLVSKLEYQVTWLLFGKYTAYSIYILQLGSLLSINEKKPYESFRAWTRQYGAVYQLYLGGVRAVVLGREDLIRSTFAMDAASGRAPLYLTFGIMEGMGECSIDIVNVCIYWYIWI